jgi:hypothetical protein
MILSVLQKRGYLIKEKIMSMQKCSALKPVFSVVLVLFIWILAPVLHAQQNQGDTEYTQKRRRKPGFSLRFGSYFPSLETTLRIDPNTQGSGTEINLEDVLKLDSSPIVVRGDADIRVLSWLSLDLGFYAINRSKTTVIDRDIQIGETIFNLNQTLNAKFNTTYLRTNIKFSFIHNPRLDLGVWAGASFAFFELRLDAQEAGDIVIEEDDVWAPIPAAGIHISYTLIPNLYLFGKVGYFYYGISENFKFTSTSFDINLNYYFFKFLGVGATYEYNLATLDGQIGDFSGKISNKFGGFQIYGIIGF